MGGDGEAVINNDSSGSVGVAVTVLGYFTDGGPGEAAGQTFVAVPDAKLLDTRTGVGAPQQQIAAGGSVTVQVTGNDGVPSDAVGVAGYVAGANASSNGYVSVYPAGTTDPGLAELTYQSGEVDRDYIQSGVGSTGAVTLTNEGSVATDLEFDVTGYFVSPTGGAEAGSTFVPLPSTQVENTTAATPLAAGASVTFTPTGVGAIPSSGVSDVTESISAMSPTATGYLTAYPGGTADPGHAVVNFSAGDGQDNDMNQAATIGLSGNGSETITNHSSGTVQVEVHARGYFVAPQAPSAPDTVEGSVDSTGTATVTWTAPNTDGGAAATSYDVTVTDANGNIVASGTYGGQATSATYTGLDPTATYTATVTASNGVGESDGTTTTVGDTTSGSQASGASFASSQISIGLDPGTGDLTLNSASASDGTLDSSGNIASSESDPVATSVTSPNQFNADAYPTSGSPDTSTDAAGSGYPCVVNTNKGANLGWDGTINDNQHGNSWNMLWTTDLYQIKNARYDQASNQEFYEAQYCTAGTADTKNGYHEVFVGNAFLFLGTNSQRLIGWKWGSGSTTDGHATTNLSFELSKGVVDIGATVPVTPGSGSLTGDFGADGNFGNFPPSWDSYNDNRINTFWHSSSGFIWDGTSEGEGNTGHALYEWPQPVGNLNFDFDPYLTAICSLLTHNCTNFN